MAIPEKRNMMKFLGDALMREEDRHVVSWETVDAFCAYALRVVHDELTRYRIEPNSVTLRPNVTSPKTASFLVGVPGFEFVGGDLIITVETDHSRPLGYKTDTGRVVDEMLKPSNWRRETRKESK